MPAAKPNEPAPAPPSVRCAATRFPRSWPPLPRARPSAVKAALIEVLATRRAMDQLPAFIAASTDDDPVVRSAAMSALGQIGKPEQLAEMLPGVLKAEKGAERDAAEKNVALVCSRIDNEIKRGNELVAALKTVKPDQVDDLLSLVGRVGGTQLINFVGEIATGDDPARRKLGIDALGKWPNATVADKLMEIANKTIDPAERAQAFAGYVKICATRDKRTDAQRLARMKQAMKLAKTPQEQSLVINRSRTAYDVETLRFVLPYVDEAPLARVACETIVELAHHREIRDPNKAEFDKALDKVISASKDPVVIEAPTATSEAKPGPGRERQVSHELGYVGRASQPVPHDTSSGPSVRKDQTGWEARPT